MCDTLCSVSPNGMFFAKNSDRPPTEVQLIEAYAPRRPGGELATQYLRLPNSGAAASMLSRPEWLWGAEHGVNEHRVAIGNEQIYTTADPYAEPPGLIGMDLVRLGLERARNANEALEIITALLEGHGQGGVADASSGEPYFSSFLLADPHRGWVLETSGRTWVARPIDGWAAISNRLTLRTDWTRASSDVPAGANFDAWRNPDAPTGHADNRMSASTAFLSRTSGGAIGPARLAGHLRDHGEGPWGVPGAPGAISVVPPMALPDGTGVTVCMHVRGYKATTSAMVAKLPTDPAAPLRAWVAPGSPCVSVFVPVFPPDRVPTELSERSLWLAVAALRDRVEADGDSLAEIRAVLDPIEADLWAEADDISVSPHKWGTFVRGAGAKLAQAIGKLAG